MIDPEQSIPAVEMPQTEQTALTQLQVAIAAYKTALNQLNNPQPPSPEAILSLFKLRDNIETHLSQWSLTDLADLIELTTCDQKLKSRSQFITESGNLSQWQQTLNPPEERWWWFLSSPEVVDTWDRLDWFWNLLTITFLTGFAANMIAVVPIMFSSGLGFLESLGLVGPGGLLALIAYQLENGENHTSKIQRILSSLRIPSQLQAEFSTCIALLLLIGSHVAKENLPIHYFKGFIKDGHSAYQKGDLQEAESFYEAALKLSENAIFKDEVVPYAALGLINASIGDNKQAIHYYSIALGKTGYEKYNVLSRLGEVYLNEGELTRAEALLNMGLHRTSVNDLNAQYQLRRNLGWVYFQQEQYEAAISILDEAIKLDTQTPDNEFGTGIAYCLKAAALNKLQDLPNLSVATSSPKDHKQIEASVAEIEWQNCKTLALPETLSEYEFIIRHNYDVARQIDTSAIFE